MSHLDMKPLGQQISTVDATVDEQYSSHPHYQTAYVQTRLCRLNNITKDTIMILATQYAKRCQEMFPFSRKWQYYTYRGKRKICLLRYNRENLGAKEITVV